MPLLENVTSPIVNVLFSRAKKGSLDQLFTIICPVALQNKLMFVFFNPLSVVTSSTKEYLAKKLLFL